MPEAREEREKWKAPAPALPSCLPDKPRRLFPARGTAQRRLPARLRRRDRQRLTRGNGFGLPLGHCRLARDGIGVRPAEWVSRAQ